MPTLNTTFRRAYDDNKLQRWKRSAPDQNAEIILFPHGRRIRAALEEQEQEQEQELEQDKTEIEAKHLIQNEEARPKRHRTPPRVEIHNIRSALPQPEIEVLYTVYQGNQRI
jgi:hypothetical protein